MAEVSPTSAPVSGAGHLRTYGQIAWLWIRAAWQYPTSFVLLAVGNGLITGLDFVGLWIMFAHLDDLVEHLGRSGLDIDLRVEGGPVELPAGLDVSAYRIVQESLTNVLKHADASTATVVVAYGDNCLVLEVADDGHGPDVGSDAGHGLDGLRERVALFGGEIGAGPRPDGGFTVRATLPL